jgi:hypothetical protein
MVTSRQAALAALLGVVPTTGYAISTPEMFPYVSVVNVVLIGVALFLMTSPAEETGSPA